MKPLHCLLSFLEIPSFLNQLCFIREQPRYGAGSDTPRYGAGSDTPRYGAGSETPMHPSRTPMHPYMTPMRDAGG